MAEELSKLNYFNTEDLIIPGKSIVELFKSLDKESLKSQDIENIHDFYDYFQAQIVSNCEMDFGEGIDVVRKTPPQQKSDYDFHNEKDFALGFVEDEYDIELSEEQAKKLASELVDAVNDSDYLWDAQSEVERQCIDRFVKENHLLNKKVNKKEIIHKIHHIPDTQELTVEEINAYLEKHGLKINEEESNKKEIIIDTNDGRTLYDVPLKKKCTKEEFYSTLFNAYDNYSTLEPLNECVRDELYPVDQSIESLTEEFKEIRDNLRKATYGFDEKFDKCIAEFHAKENLTKNKEHSYSKATTNSLANAKAACEKDNQTKRENIEKGR